jgi:signal transduction histidine kinase
LLLTIEDDGVGLDASKTNERVHRGFGLAGMRERVHLIGGSITIGKRAPRGTRVVVDVPI